MLDPNVLEAVRRLTAETLGVDVDEATADALFFDDLGGESIDLLDLGFRCEKQFGVRVRFQDLTNEELLVNPDGTLAEPTLERWQRRFPLLDVLRWRGRPFNRPQELLTIGDIASIVGSEIGRSAATSGRT